VIDVLLNLSPIFYSISSVDTFNDLLVLNRFEVVASHLVGEPVKEMVVQQSAALPLLAAESCSLCHARPKPDVPLKRCAKCFRTAYCNK
jgi:hypothetical protein